MLTIRTIFQPTVLLALALMTIIVMMILPMPAWVLDIGLAVSFGLAILIFTVTLFLDRPLDFSAFPTILLASLMLRLSLNVSSTKLIIGNGHTGTSAAGDVIEGFAMFIMGGSVFMGLVVFCVLLIVNFIVITKGAARMAEVGARFALDGMPGKQLAIDSDMSAGAIDHAEAKARREREQAETTFFGSLDGASKFVKGDAIAGLLITLLNLVMGLVIGTVMHDMPIGRAFETYAILTVGDGLVTQIPAVIISIASALLLARGGTSGATDTAIVAQLGRYPSALATVGVLMFVFALVPGLPFLPFLLGSILLVSCSWFARTSAKEEPVESVPASEAVTPEKSIGDLLDLDDIHVEFAPDLVAMALDPATGLEARISNMRNYVATNFGVVLPEIRLTDNLALPAGRYQINIHGVEQASDNLRAEAILALLPPDEMSTIEGDVVAEPVYGAPAKWIHPDSQNQAVMTGCTVVTPTEILATHLLEIIKSNLGRLFTMRSLRRLLDEFVNLSDQTRSEANRRLLDQVIPEKVTHETLLQVLKLLLDERVSVRNLPMILDAIAEGRNIYGTVEGLCEHVRQKLGFQLVAEMRREDGTLPLVQLAPEWNEIFQKYQLEGDDIALPPEEFNKLATGISEKIGKAGEQGIFPAVVTGLRQRRYIQTVLNAKGISAPVFSFEEIARDARPSIVGFVPT
ncbi:MAG: flagellar biosynthesis protein FlhA [Pseudomonadota bacterium]